MKKIIFTALTVGSSFASIANSNTKHKETWDEPTSHELIGSKAEDVYYFDEIGNMLGHFGQDAREDRIRHVAGMDVDTEVPAAKLLDKPESLAEATSENDGDGDAKTTDDDDFESRVNTPEEKVARIAVTKSETYKSKALKAVKEAAISKKVANRAT
jgi:hypothetical protein